MFYDRVVPGLSCYWKGSFATSALSLVLKAFGPLISLMSWEWTNSIAANRHLELPGMSKPEGGREENEVCKNVLLDNRCPARRLLRSFGNILIWILPRHRGMQTCRELWVDTALDLVPSFCAVCFRNQVLFVACLINKPPIMLPIPSQKVTHLPGLARWRRRWRWLVRKLPEHRERGRERERDRERDR